LAGIFGLTKRTGLLRGKNRRRGCVLGTGSHRLQHHDIKKPTADQPNKMETAFSMHTLLRQHR
jgi:hypothetical protein